LENRKAIFVNDAEKAIRDGEEFPAFGLGQQIIASKCFSEFLTPFQNLCPEIVPIKILILLNIEEVDDIIVFDHR
jgi:hypothetical protein